jgi:exopolyphosphatase / guanosine-5'-triphosphate,3'-diphosphate pyrophosphatase
MPHASIDIGSNSILLLVVDDQGRVLHDSARVVGLGRGLGDRGLLRSDRVDLALEVLGGYVAIARGLGVQPANIRAVATSALRRALNGPTLLARIRELHGLQVQVISGVREAELTARGALTGLRLPPGPCLVVDAGGGSTELILVKPDSQLPGQLSFLFRHSFEIGHVRLHEHFFGDGPPRPQDVARARAHIADILKAQPFEPMPRSVVAVAGTPIALATAELGLPSLDGNAAHGLVLELFTLRRWIDRLLHTAPAERQALLPATPDRAETMLCGVLILEAVLVLTQHSKLIVSNRGVRFAIL